MRLYRVIVYRRGDLHLDLQEQEGYLVRSSKDWSLKVNAGGVWFDWSVAPSWHESREAAIGAAIEEVEDAAANTAAVLDDLRNRLVNIEQGPLPAQVATVVGHRESAAGGRDVTPAGQARCTDPPVEA